MPEPESKNDQLLPLFDQLKPLLSRYAPPLIANVDERARYELQFDKDYTTKSGRTGKVTSKHGLYFAGLIVQKRYVGFYFMPPYSHPDQFADISPRLRQAFKGKSCFYITDFDDELERELVEIVQRGYEIYDRFTGYA